MDDSCAVCAESLEWVAYGSCGHKDVFRFAVRAFIEFTERASLVYNCSNRALVES
ncbi:zinc finger protein [Artemisia annua]|uniref:Zinc finger protein n=1 Tax=Artemisia annua TaxID=35608 RepID=A0A2U1LVW3_ARTAN|nr:zinc finger protein [Artemisia annua]